MNVIFLVVLLFLVGIPIIPLYYHNEIDNTDCNVIKYNLAVPEDERYGEWFYQYYPHLQNEYEERCK